VDYYQYGFNAMIHFGFKHEAKKGYEALFSAQNQYLQTTHRGKGLLNYIDSHDDGDAFDKDRTQGKKAANVLLLAPGGAQIYYGDEVNRPLTFSGAVGDANLRTPMNWEVLNDTLVAENLAHWQKLGQFRRAHLSIGKGVHQMIQEAPYIFSRIYQGDRVVVGLEQPIGAKRIPVQSIWADGIAITDQYSGISAKVKDGFLAINTPFDTVLLQEN
jgi:alpha-amylase